MPSKKNTLLPVVATGALIRSFVIGRDWGAGDEDLVDFLLILRTIAAEENDLQRALLVGEAEEAAVPYLAGAGELIERLCAARRDFWRGAGATT